MKAEEMVTGEILVKNGFELTRKGRHEEQYKFEKTNDYTITVGFRHREGYDDFIKIRLEASLWHDSWLDSLHLRRGRSSITVREFQSVLDIFGIGINLNS